MEQKNNPLLCDPVEGICGLPDTLQPATFHSNTAEKPIKVVYFTDPICSSCWGIEPQLRKLKLEYGGVLEFEYRMGGLLPDWSYNSGGISKPSDVAHHWDEVSLHYDMPIDGDVWLGDPLHSSYPPSIAFKAAQMQDEKKAHLFLRKIRELVFLEKINIAKWENLAKAAEYVGLDVEQMKSDVEGKAKQLFEADLKEARSMGVRGFPTLFFTDGKERREVVYGSKPYASFEAAILKILPAATKTEVNTQWQALFSNYQTLTAKEFSVLSGMSRTECEAFLDKQLASGVLDKLTTKNGSIWRIQKR